MNNSLEPPGLLLYRNYISQKTLFDFCAQWSCQTHYLSPGSRKMLRQKGAVSVTGCIFWNRLRLVHLEKRTSFRKTHIYVLTKWPKYKAVKLHVRIITLSDRLKLKLQPSLVLPTYFCFLRIKVNFSVQHVNTQGGIKIQ